MLSPIFAWLISATVPRYRQHKRRTPKLAWCCRPRSRTLCNAMSSLSGAGAELSHICSVVAWVLSTPINVASALPQIAACYFAPSVGYVLALGCCRLGIVARRRGVVGSCVPIVVAHGLSPGCCRQLISPLDVLRPPACSRQLSPRCCRSSNLASVLSLSSLVASGNLASADAALASAA